MKFIYPHLGLLLTLSLSFVACGKKATFKENETREKLIDPTQEEIHFKALKELKRSVNEDDLEALKKVILNHPFIDLNEHFNDNGETLLITSIKKDHREIRNYLLEKGAKTEKASVNLETPLMAAVAYERTNSVKLLLDLKVDLEKKDINGDSALHIALKRSKDEIALLLMKQGANIHGVDGNSKNALKLAEEFNSLSSLEMIKSMMDLEQGAPDVKTFKKIILQTDVNKVKTILNRYPKIIYDKSYQGLNALGLLIDSGEEYEALQIAQLLIEHGLEVNGPKDATKSPLIEATILDKKSFVGLFLNNGADLRILDKTGRSALIHAIENNNPGMVSLLLTFSAEKKYHYSSSTTKRVFDACEVARLTAKRLENQYERESNKYIRNSLLDCGVVIWPF